MLGVAVLITVLSVMNGFDKEIKKRVFSMVSPITISNMDGYLSNWSDLQAMLKNHAEIKASAPFVSAEVLLNNGTTVQPALLNGILPDQEKSISALSNKMVKGELNDLKPHEFGIILGENLASALNASLGDKITVVTPQVSLSPAGVMPRYKRFTVVGIFSVGSGFGFDRSLGFIHLKDAQTLLALKNDVSGLHVNIENVYDAQILANNLAQQLTVNASITTWADQFGEFFRSIQLEKTMMFFILILILAVAGFNVVSTLVMVVNEKETDIAILRTFGATPRTIMNIFIIQGALVGVIGTLLGVIGGILLALNATEIVHGIEQIFHIQFLSSNVYFVNYLPSEIQLSDVLKVGGASLFMSLLATLYPAWRASKMDPVESLRYE
jgi:lipoprotein-releasing system permease protein